MVQSVSRGVVSGRRPGPMKDLAELQGKIELCEFSPS